MMVASIIDGLNTDNRAPTSAFANYGHAAAL